MRDRAVYALVGGLIGSIVGYVLRHWLMLPVFVESSIALAGALGVVTWAERSRRVQTPDELQHPISLDLTKQP